MITADFPPARSGLGDYCQMLGESLAAGGIEVTMITSSYRGIAQQSGNPAVRPEITGWSLVHGFNILRTILKTKVDIWHFQMGTREHRNRLFPYVVIPVVRFLGRPAKVVVTFHELPPPALRRNPVRGMVRMIRTWLCVKGADGLIAVSGDYKKALNASYARSRSIPCRVIPVGSNIPRSKLTLEQLMDLRARTGVGRGTLLLSYFGVIHQAKGFEQVLEVLALIRDSGARVKLMVVGELSEGDPYQRAILEQLKIGNLSSYVFVTGHLDRLSVANHLAMSDACILPFPGGVRPQSTSFLAAVSQGVLTVTTSEDKRGLDEENNIFYCAPDDSKSMAAAALTFGGRRAHGRASQSWRSIADEHLRLYTALYSSNGLADGT